MQVGEQAPPVVGSCVHAVRMPLVGLCHLQLVDLAGVECAADVLADAVFGSVGMDGEAAFCQ